MSDYMKTILDLDKSESRLNERHEKRVKISHLVTVVRDTLNLLGERVGTIRKDAQSYTNAYDDPSKRSHMEGLTVKSPEALKDAHEIAHDVKDLLEQINVVKKIVCPMSGLLEEYQERAEMLSVKFPVKQSTAE